MTHPLLALNTEALQALPDNELGDLLAIAELDIPTILRNGGLVRSEVVRRAENGDPRRKSQRLLGSQLAEVERAPGYKWSLPKVEALLKHRVTTEQWDKAVRMPEPKPAPEPRPTIHTQSMLALAKACGLETEIAECYELTFEPPKVKVTAVAGTAAAPVAIEDMEME